MTSAPRGVPAPDYGQGGYGQGGWGVQPGRAPSRPEKANTLRTMTIASLTLWLLGQVLSRIVARTEAYRQAMTDYYTDLGLSPELVEQSVSGSASSLIGSLVAFVVGLVLYLVVLRGITRGRNWARILGIVLAMISVIAMIGSTGIGALMGLPLAAGGALGLLSMVVSLALVVVNICWLVLAFNGRVAAWFRGIA